MGRITVLLLGLLVGLALPSAAFAGADEAVLAREEEEAAMLIVEDDDGDDPDTDTGGNTGGNSGTGDSNDATGSKVTGVSRDGEASRDDLTRDRTKDGPGASRLDRTGNSTNDRTRNDTR